MLNIDAKGILKNTGRITPIFPGIRPTTMIKKNCMTTSVLSFDSAVSLTESIPRFHYFYFTETLCKYIMAQQVFGYI